MRRFLLTMATAASALAVASCSDLTGVRGDVAGVYELETIDGEPLPQPVNDDQFGTVSVVYGEIELFSDGTFIDMYQYVAPGGVRTQEFSGTWELEGNSRIRFRTNNGEYFMDRTSGNRISYVDDTGSRWVYDRF
jgi:hypothetical protein